ncbi:MAG: LuxR C-terminal-related transcriptional regulator [Bacteroidales bacterium]
MKLFNKNSTVSEIIAADYNILPLLNRFGTGLGDGVRNVEAICAESGINPDFFLLVINIFIHKDYHPEIDTPHFAPDMIIDYLRKTHNYYIEYILPELDLLFRKMMSVCKENCSDLSLINKFYIQYKKELLDHIEDEEKRVFPYALQLTSGQQTPSGYRISRFEAEHSNVEEKLSDLRMLLIKNLGPGYDQNLCNEFFFSLARFEEDVTDHARLEDKILVPSVKAIERRYGSKPEEGNISSPARRAGRRNIRTSETSPGKNRKTGEKRGAITRREREIIRLVATGYSTKEIADILFISNHTVITHRKNITAKLGIRSIPGITVYAIIEGIINPDDIRSEDLI